MGCNNPKIGRMLHAYELSSLSEEDLERFELHLMKCPHCLREVEGFENEASILTQDDEAKTIVSSAIDTSDKKASLGRRILSLIRPKWPLLLRPAIAYFVVILMAFPTYRYLMVTQRPSSGPIFTITLSDTRSVAESIAMVDSDYWAVQIQFVCSKTEPGKSYQIRLKSDEIGGLLKEWDYDSFDSLGIGRLGFSPSLLKAGDYTVEVRDPEAGSESVLQIYHFTMSR